MSELADGSAQSKVQNPESAIPIVLLTPQGRLFNQQVAFELAQHDRVALICGRYEGFDERIREHLATDEISIGDYVLTGGEVAALVVVDAVIRLKPGVLGDPTGAIDDSHAERPAGVPALHAPAGISRLEGAGGIVVRRSRQSRSVAAGAGAAADLAAAARSAGTGRIDRSRSGLCCGQSGRQDIIESRP